ncbi:MAG TPA: hypothetical protein VF281_00400 [Candidatus Saccharimonadales bacterium]
MRSRAIQAINIESFERFIMYTAKRRVVLIIGLLVATSMAACSDTSAQPEQTKTTTTSQTPSNATTPSETKSSTASPSSAGTSIDASPRDRFEDMTGLNDETPKAESVGEAPNAELQPVSDIVMGEYTNNTSLTATYWASDWCHYILGTDGVTYGESCVRAALNADGTASSVQFQIYRYDPTRVEKLGDMVLELYTGYPGYTTFRDLTDPTFNQVQWAAFPTGIANLTADTFMVSFLDANGQLVWYSTQQILNMAATARANANIPQATVPAWDPAITVWSYPIISSINNQIASIPGAAY